MGKLLKYCLSFLGILVLSCNSKDIYSLSKTERKQKAQELWDIAFDSEDTTHTYLQGSVLLQKMLDSIVTYDPQHCEAFREKSVPYLKRGLPHKWKPLFDKAVACDPKTWQPWRGYLYLYFYRDYDKAIADFDASDVLTPNFVDTPQGHSVNYWRGMAYLGKKDYKKSVEYFETHIRLESEDSGEDWVEPDAFLFLGIAQYELGLVEKSTFNFQKMLKYSGEHSAEANYYLAQIKLKEKDYSASLININKSIIDFESGYYEHRPYVEEIRQLYLSDLMDAKDKIENLL